MIILIPQTGWSNWKKTLMGMQKNPRTEHRGALSGDILYGLFVK